jgi:hypothetical protein
MGFYQVLQYSIGDFVYRKQADLDSSRALEVVSESRCEETQIYF